MAGFIVLLGPPGAGKGTQAQRISLELDLPHISSGDIFRENLKQQTALGRLAHGYIQRGELVPDDLTIAMIKERLARSDCQNGAILDGFPRTPAQAIALEEILLEQKSHVSQVPFIAVDVPTLVERLSGRWTCPSCGRVYHIKYNPPRDDKRCDEDDSELYQRVDDQEETVRTRIDVYFRQTTPLIDHYRKSGLLEEIDGKQEIGQVTEQLLAAIGRR
jgi:adenylate kinase